MVRPGSVFNKIFNFYYDGFNTLSSWGKQVWIIIAVKLFVILVILKIFFFQDFLQKSCKTDRDKSNYVLNQLTNHK